MIGFGAISSKVVPHNKDLTSRACQIGCRLYGKNGGCPPFSPNYPSFARRFPYANVLFVHMSVSDFPQKIRQGNFYVRWSFVEVLQGNFIKKLGSMLHSRIGGYFLSAGHCTGCGKKACQMNANKECQSPTKREFSMESTGVLVTDLMEELFGIPLVWFSQDPEDNLPEYMIKSCMILTPDKLPIKDLGMSIKNICDGFPNVLFQ